MQPQFYMYSHAWDLEDEGLEESLGRLAGEVGVDGITVSATTSEVHQFRPRKPLEQRVFRTEAGAHFQPESRFYASARIKPHSAAWMKSRNALERIAKVCEKEKIKLRASICCCVGRAMVKRYPFAACVNALGIPSERVLCPTHPDVREYLGTVVEDLSTNFGLDAVEVTELRHERPGDHFEHECVQPRWSEAADELLSICFCSACRQNAAAHGVDADGALRAAAERLEHCLDDPTVEDGAIDCSPEAPLGRYQQARQASLLELLSRLKRRAKCHLALDVDPEVFPFKADFVSKELLSRLDRVVLGDPMWGDDSNGAAVGDCHALEPGKVDVIVSTRPTGVDAAQMLVATTHGFVQRPYHSIGFSHYGCTQEPMLEAIRQAIRFARREGR